MDSTEHILMRLLRNGLSASETPVTDIGNPVTWKKVFELSARQGILGILYDAVQKLPSAAQPPKELLLRWAVNTDSIEQKHKHLLCTLEQLTAFYARHNIRLMLLKGPGLASLYPVPGHRPCGDLDIWLYGRYKEADKLIRQELNIPVHSDVHHHTVFTFHGVMIENHFDFLNQWSHRSNRELERELRRFAEMPGRVMQVGTQQVYLPSPNFNALFLMRHMAMHFAAVEIGLRHIADWAMFLRAEGDQVDWPTINAIFKAQNMDRFADVITAVCVEHLGVDSAHAYAYTNDMELQKRIMNEVLYPEYGKLPNSNPLRTLRFKFRRWWGSRWKHKLIYKDSLMGSFLWLCWGHLIRPKTIIK